MPPEIGHLSQIPRLSRQSFAMQGVDANPPTYAVNLLVRHKAIPLIVFSNPSLFNSRVTSAGSWLPEIPRVQRPLPPAGCHFLV